eukprot:3218163-Pyramimonas_sp.AAC.1
MDLATACQIHESLIHVCAPPTEAPAPLVPHEKRHKQKLSALRADVLDLRWPPWRRLRVPPHGALRADPRHPRGAPK